VRFTGTMQTGVTLRDLVHAIPYYAIKKGLLTVEKKGKKNIFNGNILEIEGLPDLKCEQAFELADASAERSAAGCTIKLSKDSVAEFLRSNVVMLKWMIAEGYGDARTMKRRIASMEAWLANPVLMEADPKAEYKKVYEIDLKDVTEPILCCPNDPDDAKTLTEIGEDKIDDVSEAPAKVPVEPVDVDVPRVAVKDAGEARLNGTYRASFVAKEALMGQKVMVVRCEDMVISGSFIRNKLKLLMKRNKRMNTNKKKGPFHHRSPADMFTRVVRGMLPHKFYRGSAAFQRVKCCEGIPEPFSSMKKVVVPDALRLTRLRPGRKFSHLGKLATDLGWGYNDIVNQMEEKRKEKALEWYAKKKAAKAQLGLAIEAASA